MSPELPAAIVDAPPTGWRVWWTAVRPRTLTLATAPVVAGTALAWAEGAPLLWPIALVVLLAALLIQIGTNLHNDAADYERGNDLADRLGPLRVTAAGWATSAQVRTASRIAFGLALLLGVFLVAKGGWPILAIGAASLTAGIAYSGGRRPISHTPFGELFVWIFFGIFAVVGSYWLQAGTLSTAAWIAGAAVGFPAAAVLLVNNLRDVVIDTRSGRRTLAAVLGDGKARQAYALLMFLPFASLPLLSGAGLGGAWLALLTLPACLALTQRMRHTRGPALNGLLAQTAQCALAFAVLLALGMLFI
ncbi:MAG: 1,4-dihydroxy-2-naphthoate polyprenyltransferase [Sulfuritalea sp.]|nr:1,4-dihydroxy-2-naphthoate polyprenyltransferase [Sulfuritalea sp.]